MLILASWYYWTKSKEVIVNNTPITQLSQAEFGKLLFEDKRLSRDATISCTSCHIEKLAFTDGKPKSIGIGGKIALRNAPSLFNLTDVPHFMFDGAVPTLEMQAIIPIQDVNEMGFSMGELVQRLKGIKKYADLSKSLYKRELDAYVITRALASFERTLVSKNSKFDRFKESNYTKGFTASEKRGWEIFSKELNCIECHALPNFTSYQFKSNRLTALSDEDEGRFRITGHEEDKGLYKVPSLRNVAITAPYMHDGSYSTLDQVLQEYFKKKGNVESKEIPNINLNPEKLYDLKSFLYTLTDSSLVKYLPSN